MPSAEYLAACRMFGDMVTLAIIYFLAEGPKRLTELQRLICAKRVTLTARLKRLVTQGVITRAEHETDRQAVTYALDALGEQAVPIVREIERFAGALTDPPRSPQRVPVKSRPSARTRAARIARS
jgi:DNA-binding HxlR family transcriptional regulator